MRFCKIPSLNTKRYLPHERQLDSSPSVNQKLTYLKFTSPHVCVALPRLNSGKHTDPLKEWGRCNDRETLSLGSLFICNNAITRKFKIALGLFTYRSVKYETPMNEHRVIYDSIRRRRVRGMPPFRSSLHLAEPRFSRTLHCSCIEEFTKWVLLTWRTFTDLSQSFLFSLILDYFLKRHRRFCLVYWRWDVKTREIVQNCQRRRRHRGMERRTSSERKG